MSRSSERPHRAACAARCGRSEDRDTFATVGYGKHVKFWELQQPDEALDEYQAESANAVWDQDNNPVTDSWRAVYLGWPSRVLLTAGENGLVYAWFDKKCVASFRAHARGPCLGLALARVDHPAEGEGDQSVEFATGGADGQLKVWLSLIHI